MRLWHVSKYNSVSRELTLLWHTVNPALLTVQTAEILKQIRVKFFEGLERVWEGLSTEMDLSGNKAPVSTHISLCALFWKWYEIQHNCTFSFYRFHIKPGVWDLYIYTVSDRLLHSSPCQRSSHNRLLINLTIARHLSVFRSIQELLSQCLWRHSRASSRNVVCCNIKLIFQCLLRFGWLMRF